MIEWNDSYLVGIPTVDNDHKQILKCINCFLAVLESKEGILAIHSSFRDMERSIYRHLAVEEKMLHAVGFVHAGHHADCHAELIEQLEEIWENMLVNPNFSPDEPARRWLETWLFAHVGTEDFLYRDWIFDNGREALAEEQMSSQGGFGT